MENLFSSKFKELRFDCCSKPIQACIIGIERLAIKKSVRVFSALNGFIGISFKVEVSIPSRGAVHGIDIQEIEPIFILIEPNYYPYNAPMAFSDRMDFPSEKLPHLNPVPKGFPANFCLHRGNLDEWFCEHNIEDYVYRIISWLRDAARNRLIKLKNQDEFEITRISKSFGYNVYNPSDIIGLIEYDADVVNSNFAFLWYEIIKNDPLIDKNKAHFSVKYVLKVNPDNQEEIVKLSKEINKLEEAKSSLNKRNIGILLYAPQDYVTEKYYSVFPTNYIEFETWCIGLKLNIREALKYYLENKFQCVGGIPVSIVIQRPKKLIGTNSNLEILNFVIGAGGELWPKENSINKESKVYILENRKPVDIKLAKELSDLKSVLFNKKSVFIGCGAVGSKLIMHLAKSGLSNYEIIDEDKLSPHNLIRHALLANSTGKYKAEATKEEIENIFYSDKSNLSIASKNIKGEKYLQSLTITKAKEISTVIDTTASNSFQLFLSDYEFNSKTTCIRCEIAFDGKLGILKIEGDKRAPRLDDLNIYLIDLAIDNSLISSWLLDFDLKRQNGNFEFEEINVGVSCNSNTLKLSDDIISFHTSAFSLGIKNAKSITKGIIQLSMLSEDASHPMLTERIIVGKVLELKFRNDSNWRVRIQEQISNALFKELEANKPNETGGLLIGKIDALRKIIYITRFTKAPSDSVKKPYYFIRGTKNVPEEIGKIRHKTGGLIDYVGEWHTHPAGGNKPSSTDFTAVNELRNILDKIPYPTFIIIVSPTKINPYIFGPESLIH
jgi:integrative and conjugative element protein (TIGR02256 family)